MIFPEHLIIDSDNGSGGDFAYFCTGPYMYSVYEEGSFLESVASKYITVADSMVLFGPRYDISYTFYREQE